MEFIISENFEKSLPTVIDFNFEALKADLSERLTVYRGLVVTEDAIKSAKTDKARLNKLRGAIEDKRKEVKKQCLAPYEEFERKVKQIVALIDEPIKAIDDQIKAFEDATKAEKKDFIEQFYKMNIGDLSGLLKLPQIWDEKWLNATVKLPQITESILTTIQKVKTDLAVIATFDKETARQMQDIYLTTLDFSKAMAEKTRLDQRKKDLEAFEASQAMKEIEKPKEAPEVPIIEIPQDIAPTFVPEEVKHYDIRLFMTDAQKAAFKAFVTENGIKYSSIPKEEK